MSKDYPIKQHLNTNTTGLVKRFGVEVERLWVTPVAGQGETRTFLRIENHFDGSTADPGRPPCIVGRTIQTPTDDQLAALQRQVRVFLLEKEPTNFNKIIGYVTRAFQKAGLSDPDDFLRRCEGEGEIQILKSLGCPVGGRDLIRLWFNSELFHRDAAKKAKLDDIRVRVGDGVLRAWMMIAFAFVCTVIIKLHVFLKDRTDVYDE